MPTRPNQLALLEDSLVLPGTTWEINESNESSGLVDGVHVLARAVGPAFLVDGASKNKRFYKRSLWEKVIRENEDRFKKRQSLGTIGHEQELDDAALREGKASHLVHRMWIDEGQKVGMAEILVLNTESGRNLNTYLRAGVQLPVSSRGFGEYQGSMGENQIIDPDTFQFETFDFVRSPGVDIAVPRLVEAKKTPTQEESRRHLHRRDFFFLIVTIQASGRQEAHPLPILPLECPASSQNCRLRRVQRLPKQSFVSPMRRT